MRQPNSTDKNPGSACILSAQRFEGRLSALITHHRLLITVHAFWCNSVTNSAINRLCYSSASAILRVLCVIAAESRKTLQMGMVAGFVGCSRKLGTTLKLHQNYTENDLEHIRNALGTPRKHLEQCNSP